MVAFPVVIFSVLVIPVLIIIMVMADMAPTLRTIVQRSIA